jgi:hypothetical protein
MYKVFDPYCDHNQVAGYCQNDIQAKCMKKFHHGLLSQLLEKPRTLVVISSQSKMSESIMATVDYEGR